jgi:hypothetical protein
MEPTIKLPRWKLTSNYAQFNLAEFGIGRNIENSSSINNRVHINIRINTPTYQIFQEYFVDFNQLHFFYELAASVQNTILSYLKLQRDKNHTSFLQYSS